MFLKYRIRNMQLKLDKQTELVSLLKLAEKEYNVSYYTNKLHDAVLKRIEISSKLKYLQDKLPETSINQ